MTVNNSLMRTNNTPMADLEVASPTLDACDGTSDQVVEDIEAYARIFTETVSGISTGLANMAETLASLQSRGSDAERRLLFFSTAARNINIQRGILETMVKRIIKASHHMAAVCDMIGNVIHKLREVLEEFMRSARERIKNFAKKLRDMFGHLVDRFSEGFSAFISMLRRVLSGVNSPAMVSI